MAAPFAQSVLKSQGGRQRLGRQVGPVRPDARLSQTAAALKQAERTANLSPAFEATSKNKQILRGTARPPTLKLPPKDALDSDYRLLSPLSEEPQDDGDVPRPLSEEPQDDGDVPQDPLGGAQILSSSHILSPKQVAFGTTSWQLLGKSSDVASQAGSSLLSPARNAEPFGEAASQADLPSPIGPMSPRQQTSQQGIASPPRQTSQDKSIPLKDRRPFANMAPLNIGKIQLSSAELKSPGSPYRPVLSPKPRSPKSPQSPNSPNSIKTPFSPTPIVARPGPNRSTSSLGFNQEELKDTLCRLTLARERARKNLEETERHRVAQGVSTNAQEQHLQQLRSRLLRLEKLLLDRRLGCDEQIERNSKAANQMAIELVQAGTRNAARIESLTAEFTAAEAATAAVVSAVQLLTQAIWNACGEETGTILGKAGISSKALATALEDSLCGGPMALGFPNGGGDFDLSLDKAAATEPGALSNVADTPEVDLRKTANSEPTVQSNQQRAPRQRDSKIQALAKSLVPVVVQVKEDTELPEAALAVTLTPDAPTVSPWPLDQEPICPTERLQLEPPLTCSAEQSAVWTNNERSQYSSITKATGISNASPTSVLRLFGASKVATLQIKRPVSPHQRTGLMVGTPPASPMTEPRALSPQLGVTFRTPQTSPMAKPRAVSVTRAASPFERGQKIWSPQTRQPISMVTFSRNNSATLVGQQPPGIGQGIGVSRSNAHLAVIPAEVLGPRMTVTMGQVV